MDYSFWVGLAGSLILVTGAAWSEHKEIKSPVRSVKNWLLASGGIFMLGYSIMGYLAGGAIFFIFLQALVLVASVMMMLDVDDRIDAVVMVVSGLALIIWSLYLFEGYTTILFILGLIGIGLGYTFKMGTLKRSVALMLGGVFIGVFSYLEASWIFFWLNVFFSIFSAYYVLKGSLKPNSN